MKKEERCFEKGKSEKKIGVKEVEEQKKWKGWKVEGLHFYAFHLDTPWVSRLVQASLEGFGMIKNI